jgi:hypothetical protein
MEVNALAMRYLLWWSLISLSAACGNEEQSGHERGPDLGPEPSESDGGQGGVSGMSPSGGSRDAGVNAASGSGGATDPGTVSDLGEACRPICGGVCIGTFFNPNGSEVFMITAFGNSCDDLCIFLQPEGPGYCSAPCETDADCAGGAIPMVCSGTNGSCAEGTPGARCWPAAFERPLRIACPR